MILLTIPDVSERLGLTPGALAQMRYEGRGPAFIKVSARQVRYVESDLDDWIVSQRRTSTKAA